MKATLEPQTIYWKISQNKIKMIEGIELLLSIIEKSENNIARLESLNILFSLKTHDQIVFKTLENCVISDESEEIRIIAAKIILENYFQTGYRCLKWVLLNDNSSRLLNILGKVLNDSKTNHYQKLYAFYLHRLENIAKKFDMVSEEIPFLLDLDFSISNYNFINWNSTTRLIYDENIMFQIQDQHISELCVSLRRSIPSSINLLKELTNLNLSCNYLTELPDTISDLTNLKNLDLSWNDFTEVPKILRKINKIEKINFQNNLIQE